LIRGLLFPRRHAAGVDQVGARAAMFERAYRQRLEADLARWQADGVITPAAGTAIRAALPPLPAGITVASVVGIVGGLLIAAAFLAFIAANWTAIARPTRFAILLAGIAGAYGIGAWFDRIGRSHLADLAVAVGSIVFGAAIALVGQMYHLGEDFAGGLLLWAAGALAAAVLTGSRGALAVALAVACGWSSMRVFDTADVHLPFLVFWLIAACLGIMWKSAVARHLVALAAVVWLIHCGLGVDLSREASPDFTVCAGAALLLGAGLALTCRGPEELRALGDTLATYGAFAIALTLACVVAGFFGVGTRNQPLPIVLSGAAGVVLAFAAAALDRRLGMALAGVSSALALAVAAGRVPPVGEGPWLGYALALASMLCLVLSGMLDDARSRLIAGWIGLASTIAAITWAVKGSLLDRAVFLAVAGLVAVALAILLGRIFRKEPR
jgi:uncharacterized membrane protein